jgi:predicted DsbA family dithiol-disulfide isomerase
MRIDVWSDIACPWCFLGKHRLDAALAQVGGDHEVVYRAFELNPGAPKAYDDGLTHSERIGKKLGIPPAQMEAMHTRMRGLGEEVGIAFQFDRVKGGNTFDAHRVVRLGLERGIQPAVKERMMKAYFTDGEPIADRDALVRIATDAGLDAAEVTALLAGDRLTEEVRADETMAQELGITGVPFFVLAGKYAISGAQPTDVMIAALTRAAS